MPSTSRKPPPFENKRNKVRKLPPRVDSKKSINDDDNNVNDKSKNVNDTDQDSDEIELASRTPKRIHSASTSYGLRNDATMPGTLTDNDETQDDIETTLNNSNLDPDSIAVARGELGANLGPYAVSYVITYNEKF